MIKLTKEQEEAIEKLKYIDRYYDCNNYYSRYDLDCIEIVLNLIQEQQEENEKKDKIIDLMAKSLIGVIFSDENNVEIIFEHKEELKQYFENQAKM